MRLIRIAIFFFVTLNASASIQGGEAIKVGGIKQWIQYSGPSEKASVLLFIHGGPGNSVISYADKFTRQLSQHFIVVHWDQRESGKTAELNPSEQPLTVELFINDAIEVITHLQKKFSQQNIYLIGHSWGGYLGLRVAARRPDLLNGYFALSPMINQQESERLSLKAMQQKAIEENNKEAQEELIQIEIPFKTGTQLYYHRKWLSKLQGSNTPTKHKVEEWAATWLALFNEGSKTNFLIEAPELVCPVYFLIGSHDYQTHFSLAEAYYQKLICPEKKFFWFTNSAHSPNITETAKFEKTIIEVINID
jgi:pimeloyl-ACP methyl ester carboxylesterase